MAYCSRKNPEKLQSEKMPDDDMKKARGGVRVTAVLTTPLAQRSRICLRPYFLSVAQAPMRTTFAGEAAVGVPD